MQDVVLGNGDLGVFARDLGFEQGRRVALLLDLRGHHAVFDIDLLGLGSDRLQGGVGLFILVLGDRDLVLVVAQDRGALVEGIEPQGDLETALLTAVLEELLRLFGLDAQGLYPVLELGDDIAQTKQVFFGMSELTLGFCLAVAIARDTRGFFKDLTPVLGL